MLTNIPSSNMMPQHKEYILYAFLKAQRSMILLSNAPMKLLKLCVGQNR